MTDADYKQMLLEELRGRFPALTDVRIESGKDQTGDPALWVWLILREAAFRKNARPALRQMEEAVRRRVSSVDPSIWPYIRFRTDAEQREVEKAPSLYE